MANKLMFNVEELQSFRVSIHNHADEMRQTKDTLKKSLEQLKRDWQTDAGEKFFEETLPDWETDVNKYLELINTLEKMIKKAEQKYSQLENKAGGSALDYAGN